ncbi:MAG: HNH endonuclease [Bacteroidales bacterium]|nr:HNH endonuclease [Bacteroidales bacterium]MCF8387943.1 HNH endonuclease [Bacteroidales bacterium]MCF8399319.1 HNH endonuclease [Bacteroidales bacterium]
MLIEQKVKDLLIDFGPPRKNVRPYYPFIRLANDNIWSFNKSEYIDTKRDYPGKYLIENNISAGFNSFVLVSLKQNPGLIKRLVDFILNNNFPASLHPDILRSTGLSEFLPKSGQIRDPNFREKILVAYNFKCAICDYAVRIKNQLVGVEAAHIKWHQAGGPSEIINGIALCSLHHKLFDSGAFTINDGFKIIVSEMVNGSGSEEILYRYDNKEINYPRNKKYFPDDNFLEWHVCEVFKDYKLLKK